MIGLKPLKYMKPRENKYSVVSFFCGCGGLDLGFMGGFAYKNVKLAKLPFEMLAAYDSDEKCIQTYRENISQHAKLNPSLPAKK